MDRVHKSAGRAHRERAQPAHRQRFGELEKKKDYKKRAKDAQLKKAALKQLYKRALEKNPDEFDFHMINSQLKDGIHYEKDKSEQLADKPLLARLRQGQKDRQYVQYKMQVEQKKIERLQAQLHMTDAPQLNKRTVFVDDDEEARIFDAAEYLQCPPIAVAHGSARVRAQQLKEGAVAKNAESQQDVVYKELELRQKRMRELQLVHEKLEKQMLIMKTPKSQKPREERKNEESAAPVYKWPYVRRR